MEIFNVEMVFTKEDGQEEIKHLVIEADDDIGALSSIPAPTDAQMEGFVSARVRVAGDR